VCVCANISHSMRYTRNTPDIRGAGYTCAVCGCESLRVSLSVCGVYVCVYGVICNRACSL